MNHLAISTLVCLLSSGSAQFFQNYLPGSQSQNFNGAFPGLGVPLIHRPPHMAPLGGGSTFHQNYGMGSHAVNVNGRKRRAAQFHQNYHPGSQSQNFNGVFSAGVIPQMQQFHGSHVSNGGGNYMQNYFSGSTGLNMGRRRRSPQFLQSFATGSFNFNCFQGRPCAPHYPTMMQQSPMPWTNAMGAYGQPLNGPVRPQTLNGPVRPEGLNRPVRPAGNGPIASTLTNQSKAKQA